MTTSPNPNPPLDLDAIRARAVAATPGPWTAGGGYVHPWEVVISRRLPLVELTNGSDGRADADFIAHARTDVPALLDEVGRLNALLAAGGGS